MRRCWYFFAKSSISVAYLLSCNLCLFLSFDWKRVLITNFSFKEHIDRIRQLLSVKSQQHFPLHSSVKRKKRISHALSSSEDLYHIETNKLPVPGQAISYILTTLNLFQ